MVFIQARSESGSFWQYSAIALCRSNMGKPISILISSINSTLPLRLHPDMTLWQILEQVRTATTVLLLVRIDFIGQVNFKMDTDPNVENQYFSNYLANRGSKSWTKMESGPRYPSILPGSHFPLFW